MQATAMTTMPANNSELALRVYKGSAGSGKTTAIINDIAALLGCGEDNASAGHEGEDKGGPSADAGKVLVLCASPLAAQAFARQAKATLGANVQELQVTTARELALQILATPGVIDCSGREARMLSGVSFRFLMEDMKTTSLKPKRLQEMLLFFYKSFTELADAQEDWLMSEEERMVHGALQRFLDMRCAYIEPQLSAAALRAVEDDDTLLAQFGAAHVFVDDYQTLSRASQLLACTLASQSLTVSFDPAGSVEVFDSYPYAKGLNELRERYPQAQVTTLDGCKKAAGIANALGLLEREAAGEKALEGAEANTAVDAADANAGVCVSATKTPLDEFKQLASSVAQHRVKDSTCSIAVAVPNASWANNCSKALAAASIASEAPLDRARCIAGGNPTTSANARTLALLRLIADPQDALAWRDWCGFGDHLANSAAFETLAGYTQEHGITLPQALETFAAQGAPQGEDGSESLKDVLLAYSATKAQVEKMRGASFTSAAQLLVVALSYATNGHIQNPAPYLAELCLGTNAQNEAATSANSTAMPAPQLAERMCSHADALLAAPRQLDQDAVLIAPFGSLAGYSASALFIAGLVNGFFPDYDYFDTTVTMLDRQAGVHQNDARTLYALVSAAQTQLHASCFTSIDLEAAEKLRVKAARIYLEDSKRICQTIPSDFLPAF